MTNYSWTIIPDIRPPINSRNRTALSTGVIVDGIYLHCPNIRSYLLHYRNVFEES